VKLTPRLVVKMYCAVLPLPHNAIMAWHLMAHGNGFTSAHFIWSGRLGTIDFKFIIHSWAAKRMIQIAWLV